MLSYACIQKGVMHFLELSLSEVCGCAHSFFFFLLPPHCSINFQLRAATVVSELVIQVTVMWGKKQVRAALVSYDRKHFHLTLKWKATNASKKWATITNYDAYIPSFLSHVASWHSRNTFKQGEQCMWSWSSITYPKVALQLLGHSMGLPISNHIVKNLLRPSACQSSLLWEKKKQIEK